MASKIPSVTRQASDHSFLACYHDTGFDDFRQFFRIPVCKVHTTMARCFADA